MHRLACAQCHAPFEAVRRDARYCSDACRQEAHRGQPPRSAPRPRQQPPPEPPPLDPTRRAWLSLDGRRCWFQINWAPNPRELLTNPTDGAHAELGQWWIGNTRVAVDILRSNLAQCRAEVIELDHGGPLPPRFLLELTSSPHRLERSLYELLMATPPERWRSIVKRLAADAHPDRGRRPEAADDLLKICYELLAEPALS